MPEGGARLRELLQEAIELAGTLRWQSRQAEHYAEDVAVYATDALDSLKRAAKQEAEGDQIPWADTVSHWMEC